MAFRQTLSTSFFFKFYNHVAGQITVNMTDLMLYSDENIALFEKKKELTYVIATEFYFRVGLYY